MLPCNQYTAAEAAPLPASGKYIVTEPDAFYRDAEIADRLALYPATNKFYASHKQLDDYVAELAMQLYHASSAPIAEARVAVAGFAELTPARNNLHPLGNALSERFLQQMPRYGVTMVDHKLTGRITLTADGDAVFSNKAGQVAASQQIDYILSGTVQHSQRGAQVNVRLMNLKSKAVLATASQLIPQFVLDNVVYHW
ncbi:FlgO family outer membrane protein [Arsukibacterium sp.]|uniref:FlgO family outer membrane protein n=1 Tax=Arsukibacterium sp. TaxID=1977258 RepID=UPI00299D8544|nr:FlgO family outer membrane protein [Arsukibacterium sp.]MDX1677664.1 FlgO family outer membrane protein [Arsukibacterium sp.]